MGIEVTTYNARGADGSKKVVEIEDGTISRRTIDTYMVSYFGERWCFNIGTTRSWKGYRLNMQVLAYENGETFTPPSVIVEMGACVISYGDAGF